MKLHEAGKNILVLYRSQQSSEQLSQKAKAQISELSNGHSRFARRQILDIKTSELKVVDHASILNVIEDSSQKLLVSEVISTDNNKDRAKRSTEQQGAIIMTVDGLHIGLRARGVIVDVTKNPYGEIIKVSRRRGVPFFGGVRIHKG